MYEWKGEDIIPLIFFGIVYLVLPYLYIKFIFMPYRTAKARWHPNMNTIWWMCCICLVMPGLWIPTFWWAVADNSYRPMARTRYDGSLHPDQTYGGTLPPPLPDRLPGRD